MNFYRMYQHKTETREVREVFILAKTRLEACVVGRVIEKNPNVKLVDHLPSDLKVGMNGIAYGPWTVEDIHWLEG